MGLTYKPNYRIRANDADITAVIQKHFQSLRITDASGLESDTLEIMLADTDPKNPIKKPRKGAELVVELGYGDELRKMGMYVCDEIEIGGWPGYMTIRARAAVYEETPKGKSDLQSQKTRSWERGTTIGAMAAKIAKEHGMKHSVSPALAKIALAHIDQTEESDLSFLIRVLRKHDAIVKPAGGVLVVAKRGESKTASGVALPVVTIDAADCASFALSESARESAGTVVAYYNDKAGGKRVSVKVGSGEPVLTLRHANPSRATAIASAQSELDKRERRKNKIALECVGNEKFTAECSLLLTGFRTDVPRRYIVTRVEHGLDGGGYSCRIEAETDE